MKLYDWQKEGWLPVPDKRPADELLEAALAYFVVGVLVILAAWLFVRVG